MLNSRKITSNNIEKKSWISNCTNRNLYLQTKLYSLNLQRGSPTSTECDFHCCALHSSGQAPPPSAATSAPATMSSSHKSSATAAGAAGAPVTSPMLQQQESTTSAIAGAGGGVDGKRSLPKGAHVRFSHVEVDGAAQDTGKK